MTGAQLCSGNITNSGMCALLQVLPLVLELTKRVTARMADTPLVDVTDGAKRITSDIMGVLLLGEDLGGTLWE